MDSFFHWLRQPHPNLNLVLSLLALGLVATLILLEYAMDWPIPPRMERMPGPDLPHR